MAIDLAGIFVAVRLWRARLPGAVVTPRAKLYLAWTIVVMALALLAVVHGVWTAFGPVNGESVDPSQKARILAEGISEALNDAAFAMLAATPLAIAVLVYAWVRRPRRAQ
jgi:hypothetical protein